jgi:hypothetical protein
MTPPEKSFDLRAYWERLGRQMPEVFGDCGCKASHPSAGGYRINFCAQHAPIKKEILFILSGCPLEQWPSIFHSLAESTKIPKSKAQLEIAAWLAKQRAA